MEQSDLTLKKPNAALVMLPKTGKLTGIERKLFNSVLMSSISQMQAQREQGGKEIDATYLFTAPAEELLDVIEVGKSNLKSALRKNMHALRLADVVWEAPDAKVGTIWESTAVLPKAAIELRNGRLHAAWKLSDELCDAIKDTKEFPFTKLDLAQIAKLSSYTAVALYEICARYRNNFLKGGDGICLTSANEPEWWVDALTNNIPKLDKKTQTVVRREWRKVKNEAVLKALVEIKAMTDLDVDVIEKKVGKAVTQVQFSVRQKRATAIEMPSAHFEVIKLGLRLGLSQIRIEAALSSNGISEVELALAKFEARLKNTELPAIDKPATYFASILKRSTPIDLVPSEKYNASLASELASTNQNTPHSKEDVPAAYSMVREAFMALPDARKADYAGRALVSLQEKKMATDRMISNANNGVWAPLLLAEMLKIFGREQSENLDTDEVPSRLSA